MKKNSGVSAFLTASEKNVKLSDRILAALERGNKVTAEEIIQIATEFGYSVTQAQLEKAVSAMVAGKQSKANNSVTANAKPKKPKRPPMSSCARGCLSYTTSWHPVAH